MCDFSEGWLWHFKVKWSIIRICIADMKKTEIYDAAKECNFSKKKVLSSENCLNILHICNTKKKEQFWQYLLTLTFLSVCQWIISNDIHNSLYMQMHTHKQYIHTNFSQIKISYKFFHILSWSGTCLEVKWLTCDRNLLKQLWKDLDNSVGNMGLGFKNAFKKLILDFKKKSRKWSFNFW